MALRFRRSIRLAPGLKVNLSKRGVSISSGIRGANVSLGRRGLYGNVGAPGTGLSYRTKLNASSGGRSTKSSGYSAKENHNSKTNITIELDSTGKVNFKDDNGQLLSASQQKILREQHEDHILEWLNEQCEQWNKNIDRILNLHIDTPDPHHRPKYNVSPYGIDRPPKPELRKPGFFDLILGRREKIEVKNKALESKYVSSLTAWQKNKIAHEEKEAEIKQLVDHANDLPKNKIEELLEIILGDIDWPMETMVSFDISDDCNTVMLDVDLPKVEDVPTEIASVATRGLKINVKSKTEAQIRKEYMTHINAIIFRLVGEVMVYLPNVTQVISSGFSQRPDPNTGQIKDEYLISSIISREQWEKINFTNLIHLDIVSCFEIFDTRRSMTKTGILKAIEPFSI